MTGRLDRRVRHLCELIVDRQVASGLFVVDVPIEVQIDRDHEVVIAIIGCRDRYFGSVRSSKEILDQVVTTQVAGLVVIVIVRFFTDPLARGSPRQQAHQLRAGRQAPTGGQRARRQQCIDNQVPRYRTI